MRPDPTSGLSPAEQDRVTEALDAARAPATRRAYASAWRLWTTWCVGRSATPFPAAPELIAGYLTDLAARGMSVASIDKAVAAIAAAHLDAGQPDPTKHPGVTRVRAGLRRTIGTAPRKQAHPLSTDEIHRIVSEIDQESLRGKRDRAIILIGFAGALRRSEIVGVDVADLSFRSGGVVVRIRRSKTDQEGEGQYVGITRGQHATTDPVAALHTWLTGAGITDPGAPLFQSIAWPDLRASGKRLSARDASRILVARADAVGLGDLPISGHSLRAGHATTAAERGVPAERLARTTRHRSIATLARYVRPAQVLSDSTSSELGL